MKVESSSKTEIVHEHIQQTVQLLQEASANAQPPSPWPEFDKSVSDLRDWLTLLDHMLKSQVVTVGDIEEIEDIIVKQKVRISKHPNFLIKLSVSMLERGEFAL